MTTKQSSIGSLLNDSRYVLFVKRYAFNPLRFAVEVVGLMPTWQQVDLLKSAGRPGCRVSVSSGHGTGKTAGYGVLALWHLLVYPKSNCIITGPRLKTVQDGVWKEFAAHVESIRKGFHGWVYDYIGLEHEKVYIKGHKLDWWITAKTAPTGKPENLAGAHNRWLMWLCDEASGIPDENFGVIGGSLTDERNRMILASQPTRPAGYFYDTHNTLATNEGGVWVALVFNSEESPLVSDSFLHEKRLEYGGVESPEYQIKVQGRFPENAEGFLLSRKEVEARIGAKQVVANDEAWGWLLLVDVAAGEYRDKSVAVLARVCGSSDDYGEQSRRMDVMAVPLFTNSRNLEQFTGDVFNLACQYSNITVLVDSGGMGVSVCQKLETLGLPNLVRVKWGNPCFKKKFKERWPDQRSQAMSCAARAIKEGRLSLPADKYKKELLNQASRLPFYWDDKARRCIMSKQDMRSKSIPSPDLFDAISFGFLEDATFMQSEVLYGAASSRKELARSRAMAALQGLAAA